MVSRTVQQQQKFSAGTHCLIGLALLVGTSGLAQSAALENPAKGTSTQTESQIPAPRKDPLQGIKARLAGQYPNVVHLSIASYLSEHRNALLVDVRAEGEFAVSRIPGAIHVADRSALLKLAKQHDSQPLILYCSVGARSADAASFLMQHNVSNVMNLAGSIFQWSNEGRPLENANGPTRAVHPFNAWWGWRYLNNQVQQATLPVHSTSDG